MLLCLGCFVRSLRAGGVCIGWWTGCGSTCRGRILCEVQRSAQPGGTTRVEDEQCGGDARRTMRYRKRVQVQTGRVSVSDAADRRPSDAPGCGTLSRMPPVEDGCADVFTSRMRPATSLAHTAESGARDLDSAFCESWIGTVAMQRTYEHQVP